MPAASQTPRSAIMLNFGSFFESQLKVNNNFRIIRPHFMRYKQATDETIDQFLMRARTLGVKCDFT